MVPCVIFEDELLLVVHKPAGWNTHAPSPFAGEGIYDWLKHREPRWSSLAIIHRLDKETSGVMVFGKTPLANRSLTEQFARHLVRKKYLLLTDGSMPRREITVKTALVRVGENTRAVPAGKWRNQIPQPPDGWPVAGGRWPVDRSVSANGPHAPNSCSRVRKWISNSRDTLYGGTPAARVFLHAVEICFADPATGETMTFCAPPNFEDDPRLSLREAMVDSGATNSFRVIHGASDGWPGWFVEKLATFCCLNLTRRSPHHRPQGSKNWPIIFRRTVPITKFFHEESAVQPRPNPRRNSSLANPRRSGLIFWKTASAMN